MGLWQVSPSALEHPLGRQEGGSWEEPGSPRRGRRRAQRVRALGSAAGSSARGLSGVGPQCCCESWRPAAAVPVPPRPPPAPAPLELRAQLLSDGAFAPGWGSGLRAAGRLLAVPSVTARQVPSTGRGSRCCFVLRSERGPGSFCLLPVQTFKGMLEAASLFLAACVLQKSGSLRYFQRLVSSAGTGDYESHCAEFGASGSHG